MGTAFQLIDDVMDYTSDGEEMGKNVGDDLAEGKPTLPLLHAMRNGTAEQAEMIRDAIEHANGMERLNDILIGEIARNCGKDFEQAKRDFTRDKWFSATDALAYGLVDEIIQPKHVR